MSIWRMAVRVATLAAALLSGTLFTACPMYGVYALYGPQPAYGVVPPPDDSTVQITDFSYTPASPIRVGDELTFILELNKPASARQAQVYIGERDEFHLYLADDGRHLDAVAADGIYTGSIVWLHAEPEVVTLPVEAYLYLHNAPTLHIDGPPLTVLPEQEAP